MPLLLVLAATVFVPAAGWTAEAETMCLGVSPFCNTMNVNVTALGDISGYDDNCGFGEPFRVHGCQFAPGRFVLFADCRNASGSDLEFGYFEVTGYKARLERYYNDGRKCTTRKTCSSCPARPGQPGRGPRTTPSARALLSVGRW